VLTNLKDLSDALKNNLLVPCFQPIVELRTGRLVGFEALARWRHPDLGLVLPTNLISLAEQNGLADSLMQQIFSKAFQEVAELPEPLTLSVNVSPCQLHDASLPDQIRALAAESKFPLTRLQIEITESALVDNIELAQSITQDLKAMGCSLAMDDFGTGYSSLQQLQSLPFDTLKVDRSFVRFMTNKRDSRKIAAAVIGLGRSLGMTTIAEGIETKEQAEIVQLLGCDLAQGWLYGKPAPAEAIPLMIAAVPLKLASISARSRRNHSTSCLEALPMQSLAQLQAIYDGASIGLCFLDRNLRHVSVNRRLAEMNGLSVEAFIGKTVKEVLPGLFPMIEPNLLRALRGEKITDVETTPLARDGGESGQTRLVSYQPAFDEAGEVIGISLSSIDITERKRIENDLRKSEDLHRQMVELSPHIPYVLDARGNCIAISTRWTQLTGLSKEETFAGGWVNAIHADDWQHAVQSIRDAVKSRGSIDMKFRVRNLDGNWRSMWSRATPYSVESGDAVRWYGVLDDIDESTRNADSLRAYTEQCLHSSTSPDDVQVCPLRETVTCAYHEDAAARATALPHLESQESRNAHPTA
jgi:PAS domain S-box-containing protein